MNDQLKNSADAILNRAVTGTPRVPGVVAMVTDRSGTIYEGAAGKRLLPDGPDMTLDTVFAIFSTTKAITATAALQLAEEGKLDLDAPAKNYDADLGKIQVLDGFDDAGKPKFRAPKRDITTRMLLLHTAGFAYELFDESYFRLVSDGTHPSLFTGTRQALKAPLLFDPGERWEYGCNIDWAGQIVEKLRGKKLGEVFAERIFAPCGMTSTAFTPTADMVARLALIHQRNADGSLTPPDTSAPPPPPSEEDMGGHGLLGTVGDYMRFIRMWLNDGAADHGRVLKAETVAMAAENGLGDLKVKMLPGVMAGYSNDAEFFPGMPKSWGLSFMINDEDAPTGRPAGALAWAGLANTYYWIDRKNGIGGYWATQLFPFADPTSVGGYLELETAAYASLKQLAPA
jgi:methyl acetate hydrolase